MARIHGNGFLPMVNKEQNSVLLCQLGWMSNRTYAMPMINDRAHSETLVNCSEWVSGQFSQFYFRTVSAHSAKSTRVSSARPGLYERRAIGFATLWLGSVTSVVWFPVLIVLGTESVVLTPVYFETREEFWMCIVTYWFVVALVCSEVWAYAVDECLVDKTLKSRY